MTQTDLTHTQPNVLRQLFETIEERKQNPPPGSYTASLFAKGENEILKKIGEEAVEVIIAANNEDLEAMCASNRFRTDLYYRLVRHPQILPNKGILNKETMWWSWRRYGRNLYKVITKILLSSTFQIHP